MDAIGNFVGGVLLFLTASGALVTFSLAQLAQTRERQRQEYAKALQSTVKWIEMPYRIRRRDASDRSTRNQLVATLHELQEEIAFHDAWLSVEAPEVASAYRDLVAKVKREAEGHLQHAWEINHSPIVPMNIGACYPVNVEPERTAYVEAVQDHLRWLGIWRSLPTWMKRRMS